MLALQWLGTGCARTLASASSDCTIKIWRPELDQEAGEAKALSGAGSAPLEALHTLSGHEGKVHALCYLPAPGLLVR